MVLVSIRGKNPENNVMRYKGRYMRKEVHRQEVRRDVTDT